MAGKWDWFKDKDEDPDDKQGEIKPEQLKSEIVSDIEARFNKFREDQQASLSPILEMANAFKENKRIQDENKTREANKERHEETQVDDDLWITDPKEANRRANLTTTRQSQATAALLMRREALEGSEFEYYAGEIKSQVDALIDMQPLENRANIGLIQNAYYTILGKNAKDIREGKLKSQAAGAGFNGTGTGAKSAESNDTPRKYSSDEKRMMDEFGLSDDDVKKFEQEIAYV